MVDVMLRLVDKATLGRLLEMPLSRLVSGFETGAFRDLRPESDPRYHRGFDVDLEGDFLEWIDKADGLDLSAPLADQGISVESQCVALLLLAEWSVSAEWRCWDGRLFLYVEPILGGRIESVDEFLSADLWHRFSAAISASDRESYSESVILDWMARREDLDETLDPSQDPRILPTMESHKSLTESLFDFLEMARTEANALLIGREFLSADSWVLGGLTLGERAGVSE
ncbi:MAG: hypothetical protein ABGX06_00210 [Candidatus Poseidoniia archaeon]